MIYVVMLRVSLAPPDFQTAAQRSSVSLASQISVPTGLADLNTQVTPPVPKSSALFLAFEYSPDIHMIPLIIGGVAHIVTRITI